MRILSFGNTLANSSETNKRALGRNVIVGFLTTIKHVRRTYQILLETWSRFSSQ